MPAFWLVNQLWFIVPVNPWKFRVSSELLYESNRPQFLWFIGMINHAGCWKNEFFEWPQIWLREHIQFTLDLICLINNSAWMETRVYRPVAQNI